MLLDLIATDNYVTFNKKLAHTLGLNEAIYINQLLNIMAKATKKDKLSEDGYVTLDRDYIFKQTTLDVDTQLKIDKKLESLNILLRDFIVPDMLKIDTELLASITAEDNIKTLSEISKKAKVNKKIDSDTKNYYIVQKLCESINSNNADLDVALKGWIESCVVDKKVFLNTQMVEKFQKDLYDYSKGKLEVAKEIVSIATLRSYRDCGWAIKVYESDKANKLSSEVKEVATTSTLSKKSY